MKINDSDRETINHFVELVKSAARLIPLTYQHSTNEKEEAAALAAFENSIDIIVKRLSELLSSGWESACIQFAAGLPSSEATQATLGAYTREIFGEVLYYLSQDDSLVQMPSVVFGYRHSVTLSFMTSGSLLTHSAVVVLPDNVLSRFRDVSDEESKSKKSKSEQSEQSEQSKPLPAAISALEGVIAIHGLIKSCLEKRLKEVVGYEKPRSSRHNRRKRKQE